MQLLLQKFADHVHDTRLYNSDSRSWGDLSIWQSTFVT